ncbi:extracellular solute-binding protein [Candidatus Halobonum tyrrellensis]|uniref:Extracellular solute-binding protein family 1 n=1 Tax=Candidatus Halobonum tyrrellensis G22 TaxID=1324957 RepID=V4HAJ7_9EURY|nr:extracellular solute-binding protein [Candidatus Halobonum tyrrellensis]ESP87078.1 extracellular solute-binding protein family 1 [Candidatus Halobonum tyrrellensis G22]
MAKPTDPDARRRQFLQALGVAGTASLAGCSVSTGGGDGNGDGDSGDGGTGDGGTGDGGTGDGGTGTDGGSGSQMASAANGWGWNIAARALQDAAETYNEEADAEVTVEELGGDAWEQRFQTAVTSGSGAPDFSVVQNYDVTNYASIDGLTDLTSRIEEAGITEDIVEGKWQTVSYEDSYYAIPWDIGPTGVFYKRDRYEEAGIDPESLTTWDAFIEAGSQLPDDVAMINLPTQDMAQLWRMLIRQRGGQAFTDDGAVAVGSEDSVAVAQLMMDMQDAGITTRIETWSGGWFTAFAEGTLASVATAAWMDGTLRAELPDTSGNWGVYKLPAFEEGGTRASNRGGSNMAIPSQIDDDAVVNRAYDYCLWAMTTPEAQNRMLEDYGLFPSLTTAYEADIYDQEQEFYGGQPVFGLFAEVAQEIEPYNYTTDTPEVQDAIETELGNMLDGDKSPQRAMEDAAETVADRTDREVA